ncbi:MAG: TonB-dependent receptor [Paracoccus sp. (in: a-proteobacteria)]|nr:TonB-dependent receptor [Paracoccus sp. (in: a-proteobacteria)]
MRCHLSVPALCAVLPLIALPAMSQDMQQPFVLDDIVLSAGIAPLPADAVTRAHTVLTAEDIAARGAVTVQDALRGLPGVSVSSSGTSLTAVRIRGSESNHVLVLIDGIEAAGGADTYNFSGLGTADIERIEVLRGPQSVIYGSNASAGVINIITRAGADTAPAGFSGRGMIEAGNGGAASLLARQRGAQGGVALSLEARDDRGHDHSGDGGDKDGIIRKSATLAGDLIVTPELRFGTVLRRSDERFDYDSTSFTATDAASYVVDSGNRAERDEFTGAVWGEYAMMDGRLTHRIDIQQTIEKRRDNGGPVTRGETQKLKYRANLSLDDQPVAEAGQLLSILAEKQRDENTNAPGRDRRMHSIAAEYRLTQGNLDLQAGLRRDVNRSFKDFTSWNLGLGWRIPEHGLRLHASAGKGLVNPSFFELFADAFGYVGNPELRPEKNRGYDIGIEAELPGGRGIVDLTYFNEKLEDEITDVFLGVVDGANRFSFVNQSGRSPRQGVELTARLRATDDLGLGLSYTYLDATNPDGSVEIRRPKHELGLTATLALFDGRGQISGDLRHVSGNFDTQFWGSFETRELPSYTVVNLAGSYDLTDRVRLTGRIANLFDRDYSDVWGYASPGRTAHLGLAATW